MRERKQFTTENPIPFFMADSSDHLTGVEGLSPIVTISKNGNQFDSAIGSIIEIGKGWYALEGNIDDRDALGSYLIHAEANNADKFDIDYEIVFYDPFNIQGSSTYTDNIINSYPLCHMTFLKRLLI